MDTKLSRVSILILMLSICDSFITLYILSIGGNEVNPIMISLLDVSDILFLNGKLTITAICVWILNYYKHIKLFGILLVSQILNILFGIYILLIGYEIHVINVLLNY